MSAGQKQHTLEELAHTSGLGTQVIRRINAIFQKYPGLQQAVLYGSRAKGSWRKESDIDLTLFGEEVTWDQFLAIEREVDDLLLPWKVDLSLYHQIDNKALQEHIDRVGVLLYQSEAGATSAVGGRRQ